jgi:hypothetical protein
VSREERKVEYGYIVDVPAQEGAGRRYLVLAIRESSALDPAKAPFFVAIEGTIEELASLYGEPRELIGRRIRVEYRGHPSQGIAYLVQGAEVESADGMLTLENSGFRHAVAGEVGIV